MEHSLLDCLGTYSINECKNEIVLFVAEENERIHVENAENERIHNKKYDSENAENRIYFHVRMAFT